MKKIGLILVFMVAFNAFAVFAVSKPKIPLPDDINIVADSSPPPEYQALLGKWQGRWEPADLDIILVVERIDLNDKKVQVVYANADFFRYLPRHGRFDIKAQWRRAKAFLIYNEDNKDKKIEKIRIEFGPKLSGRARSIYFDFDPSKPDVLEGTREHAGGADSWYATMKRIN